MFFPLSQLFSHSLTRLSLPQFPSFSFVSLFCFWLLSCIKRAWRLWREWSQRPLPQEDPAGTSVFSFNSYLPHFGSFPWQRLQSERAGARSPVKPNLVLDRCLLQNERWGKKRRKNTAWKGSNDHSQTLFCICCWRFIYGLFVVMIVWMCITMT